LDDKHRINQQRQSPALAQFPVDGIEAALNLIIPAPILPQLEVPAGTNRAVAVDLRLNSSQQAHLMTNTEANNKAAVPQLEVPASTYRWRKQQHT
jgi:hypothetical protein